MKTQSRVGYLFSMIAMFVFLMNFASRITTGARLETIFTLHHTHFLIYSAIFLFTAMTVNRYTSMIQVAIVFFEGIITLTLNTGEWFFGSILIIVFILLAYSYGFLNTNIISKMIAIAFFLYLAFIAIPLKNDPACFIRALEWLAFIYGFIFLLWFIFRDSIENLAAKDSQSRKKLFDLVKQSIKTTECAMAIGEEALTELKKINSEDEHGK